MSPQAFTERGNKEIIALRQKNNLSSNSLYFLSFSAIFCMFTMLGAIDFITRMWGNQYLSIIIATFFVMILAFYLYETKGDKK